MKNITVLITGATGYLGKQLCFKLAAAQATIIALTRPSSDISALNTIKSSIQFYDSTDGHSLKKIFEQHKIDLIIHAATHYNTQLAQATHNEESNVLFPLRILEMAYTNNKPVFINIDTILEPQISTYAFTKKHFAHWLKFFAKDLVCVNASLSQFYGPFDNPARFCAKIIKDLLDNVATLDLTLGEQQRDFVHINDIVDAIMLIAINYLEKTPGYYQYQIGTGINTSLREYVYLAQKIIGNTITPT